MLGASQINAMKMMAEDLAAERDLLQALIDSLPDHIYAKDARGAYTVANAAHCDLLGAMSSEDVIGKRSQDLLPPGLGPKLEAEEREILTGARSVLTCESEIVDRAGRHRWVHSTRVPLRENGGEIRGLAGVDHDITERKRSDEQLQRAHAALTSREKELMAALADLTRSHDDLTRTQLQLIQAAKMETMGQLAASTAHEVRNPLAVIAAGLEYLTHLELPDGDSVKRVLSEMGDAVKRADSVVRGMLQFSLPKSIKLAETSLNAVIEQSVQLVKHELVRIHGTLAMDLADDLPLVSIDAGKMEQVFVNLFMNAIQAMPRGGTLAVRTSQSMHFTADCGCSAAVAGSMRPGRVVIAEVEDTGRGIPPDKLCRVFDPFFTLNGPKGNGLGLSVVRTIVELHGGMIRIRNRTEGGVNATLILAAEGANKHEQQENTNIDR